MGYKDLISAKFWFHWSILGPKSYAIRHIEKLCISSFTKLKLGMYIEKWYGLYFIQTYNSMNVSMHKMVKIDIWQKVGCMCFLAQFWLEMSALSKLHVVLSLQELRLKCVCRFKLNICQVM